MKPSQLLLLFGASLVVYGAGDVCYQWRCYAAGQRQAIASQGKQRQSRAAVLDERRSRVERTIALLDVIKDAKAAGDILAADFFVSGAGDSTYDGVYLHSGTRGGKKAFTNGAMWGVWDSSNLRWVLTSGTNAADADLVVYAYYNSEDTAKLPSSMWSNTPITLFQLHPPPAVAVE